VICRGFSTDVVPYRHVNNWILDARFWILDSGFSMVVSGSLVNLANMDNLGHQVAKFVGRLRNSSRLR